MSHSCNQQYIHFVWPTRDLNPSITEDSQDSLLGYLSGILMGLGGQLLAGSSTLNHIHLLVNTPTDLSIAELLRQMKACSSKWYHQHQNTITGPAPAFSWSEGYSAFTASPTSIENVKRYFANEQHRHKTHSFEDELISFLQFHEIDFNSKFLLNTTYTRLIYHLVWSVKNREPILNNSLQVPLHQCIMQAIQKNGCKLYAIGNVSDHIHLLIECSSKITISRLVQNLKTTSTHLIKSQDRRYATFSWQEGYGVFSVGKPALGMITNYVNNQERHHRTESFDQEWKWLRGMK